jgi:hypothetical protein
MGRPVLFAPAGWWRSAIARGMLIDAIHMVYAAQAKSRPPDGLDHI